MAPTLTVRNVAALLNVNERTVYRMANAGKLPAFKVSSSWRFLEEDIIAWIDDRKAATAIDRRVESAQSPEHFSVVSLFSGCGGMDLGFRGGFDFLDKSYQNLPFEIVWANDLNEAACRTYRRNIAPHIINGSIWDAMPNLPDSADLVIGGFPCQDISVNNGRGLGIQGKRSGLYRAMVEVVRRVKPKMFIAENVKGLLMKRNEESLRQVISDFTELGYSVNYKLYDTADYGVPQTRQRVIITGVAPGLSPFVPPAPTHTPDTFISAQMAIGDLERLPEDAQFNHVWSRAQRSAEQGNRRLVASRPGYTIRAECHGNIQYHYKAQRRISMREAARIQSFPDTFLFDAKLRETERQVGNAVPPVFAWHIANSALDCLRTESRHTSVDARLAVAG
ncbi:MAG: helix-turn-helix domain-containing protein [Dehalococcoidia bacterium]